MKITTDVNSSGLRPGGSVSTRSSSEIRSINASDSKAAQDVIVKIQREKSMIDALAIAQSSRELVQKALSISSRLMSLASEAMITGRVNMEELTSQMSSINGSMGNYGERVSVPVEGTPLPAGNVQAKLDESFARLKEKAGDMISGKKVEKKEFKPVMQNLKGIASEIDAEIKQYSDNFRNTKAIDNSSYDYAGLNRGSADLVMSNPVKALVAQGNINAEMAGKLTKI